MKRFWNFYRNDAGERVLRLEGPIDEDSSWMDGVTPRVFRQELDAEQGDVTVWINSPGGSVFAASEIYNMLCEHQGAVTVKIDAIAGSAASVIAMAGDKVYMSPVSMLYMHDPVTVAMGNTGDMEKAIIALTEIKESLINAYQAKSKMSRKKISQLMSDETWLSARKAVELGLADEIMYEENSKPTTEDLENTGLFQDWGPYSIRSMGQAVLNRLGFGAEDTTSVVETPQDITGEKIGMETDSTEGTSDVGIMTVANSSDGYTYATTGLITSVVSTTTEAHTVITPYTTMPVTPTDAAPADATSPSAPEEAAASASHVMPEESATDESAEEADNDKESATPRNISIGLDGKTENGAMPYILLLKQLELIR